MTTYDDAYKQWLIQKIIGGAYDYTYGPGSPDATPSDMNQKTGSRNNQLSTGDIALPPEDYKLFTPEERARYRIADTSFIQPGKPTPRGSVEGYFGADAQPYSGPYPAVTPPPSVAQGDGYNFAGTNTMQDYTDMQAADKAKQQKLGKSVADAFKILGNSIKNPNALSLLQKSPTDPRLAALAQSPDAAYQQIYAGQLSPLQLLLQRGY